MPQPNTLFPDDAPSTGWVTAHCDGGARGNPGPAGFGAVLQDDSGRVLAELSEFLGHRTNNFAEYAGLLGCLDWALLHQVPRLRVVSDSLLMVRQIQGKFKINSADLKPLWEEARRRIAQLERFEITHALRHKNKVADRLANEAMDRGTGRSSVSETAFTAAPSISAPPKSAQPQATMLRGFTRDGSIHLLGGTTLPDGIFVKVIPE
jgi:probable phosphoglycerate mutase